MSTEDPNVQYLWTQNVANQHKNCENAWLSSVHRDDDAGMILIEDQPYMKSLENNNVRDEHDLSYIGKYMLRQEIRTCGGWTA